MDNSTGAGAGQVALRVRGVRVCNVAEATLTHDAPSSRGRRLRGVPTPTPCTPTTHPHHTHTHTHTHTRTRPCVQVAWLVRGAAHLRAWVAGALEAATGGITKEGAAAGPEGVLEPVPPRVVVSVWWWWWPV
mgnify:CR=1 FL=1